MTEAQREAHRRWVKKNPAKVKAISKKFYYAHKDEILEYCRQRYQANLTESREYMRKQHFFYIRSIKGHLVQKWQSLTARVKGQIAGYLNSTGLDVIDKQKFLKVVMSNSRFRKLWADYVKSQFDVRSAPSFYRINTDDGYVEGNLVLLAKGDYNKQAVMDEVKRGRII